MNSYDFRSFFSPNPPRSTSFPRFTKRHMTPSGLPSVQRWQWWVLLPSQNLWGSLKTHKLINCPTHTNPAPLLSPCPANNSKHSHSPSFNRPRHKPVFTVAGVDAPLLPVGFANLSGVVPDLMPRLERRWWSWWKKMGPIPVPSCTHLLLGFIVTWTITCQDAMTMWDHSRSFKIHQSSKISKWNHWCSLFGSLV